MTISLLLHVFAQNLAGGLCDVLRPIKLHFLQRQHELYLIFLRFQILEKWANCGFH